MLVEVKVCEKSSTTHSFISVFSGSSPIYLDFWSPSTINPVNRTLHHRHSRIHRDTEAACGSNSKRSTTGN